MYKWLLCVRYLRTRYIALASIISVMLGVATMIVVNSVMSGFQNEMYQRLHGILSDVVVEAHSLEGIEDPRQIMNEIKSVLGDKVVAMTPNVHVPAMLSFQIRDSWITKQINLIGVDRETHADVSEFSQYLMHAANRKYLTFQLQEQGYDDRLGDSGWIHRRHRTSIERALQRRARPANEVLTTTDPPGDDAAPPRMHRCRTTRSRNWTKPTPFLIR